MRTWILACAVLLLAGEAARAQDEIELLDGSKIQGTIEKVEAGKIVILSRPGNSRLDIPLTYLAPYQQYKVRAGQFKLEERDWTYHATLADWCLKHYWLENAELDPRLRQAADAEFKQARQKGAPEATLAEMADRHGLLFDKDGNLKTPLEMGLRKTPEGKWVTEEEWKKLEEARAAEETKDLKKRWLIGNYKDYLRAFLPYVESMRKDYHKKCIRFRSRIAAKGANFAPPVKCDIGTITEDKYLRLILTDEDAPFAFVDKNKKKLLEKLDVIQRGERVQVCAQVFALAEGGFVVLVDDLIVD